MFRVNETEAATIQAAYEEWSAVIEMRWLFPGVTDNAHAWTCVQTIPGLTRPKAPSAGPGATNNEFRYVTTIHGMVVRAAI